MSNIDVHIHKCMYMNTFIYIICVYLCAYIHTCVCVQKTIVI